MWLEHRDRSWDSYTLSGKKIGKVLSSGRLPLVKMYSCVEFGRLGCTRFIFIKEVPCFTMTFWLKSLDPKVAFLLSHPSHPGYRASGGDPWYSIRVAPSVLGFVLSTPCVTRSRLRVTELRITVWQYPGMGASVTGRSMRLIIRVTDPDIIQLGSWKHKFHEELSKALTHVRCG